MVTKLVLLLLLLQTINCTSFDHRCTHLVYTGCSVCFRAYACDSNFRICHHVDFSSSSILSMYIIYVHSHQQHHYSSPVSCSLETEERGPEL